MLKGFDRLEASLQLSVDIPNDRAESYSRVSIESHECNMPVLSVWKGIPVEDRRKSVLSI